MPGIADPPIDALCRVPSPRGDAGRMNTYLATGAGGCLGAITTRELSATGTRVVLAA